MTRIGSKRAKKKPVDDDDNDDYDGFANNKVEMKSKRSRRGEVIRLNQLESLERNVRPKRNTRAKQVSVVHEFIQEARSNESDGLFSDAKMDTIESIEGKLNEMVEQGGKENVQEYLKVLEADHRNEVKLLVKTFKANIQARTSEEKRLYEMMNYERKTIEMERVSFEDEALFDVFLKDRFYIVGVDEVGVGPLAGPIVSCAVAFQYHTLLKVLPLLDGVNDSKKLGIAKRKELSDIIKASCCAKYNLGVVTAKEVDELNPLQGSIIAMGRAVTNLKLPAGSSVHVLVDHHTIPNLSKDPFKEQTSITKGDSKSIAIAAASIVAKVYRDDYMLKLHEDYPHFGFDRNAGYGTAQHLKELREGRLCPEHRLTYEPVHVAHRKALGLAPEDPPKKKSRAAKAVVIKPAVIEDTIQEQNLPRAILVQKENTEDVAVAPVMFSSAWWSSWFVSSPA